MSIALNTPFAALATASCPHYGEMLVGLEREFHAVDHEAVDSALDELSRPLFDLADAAPDERVVGLAAAAWTALPEEGCEPPQWFLGCGLQEGRASGALRAALAAELGRRAGIPARTARLRHCWSVHLCDGGARVGADVGADSGPTNEFVTGDLCAHQLAFAVLSGLGMACKAAGDAAKAQRAYGLLLLLPLNDELRALVRSEIQTLTRKS